MMGIPLICLLSSCGDFFTELATNDAIDKSGEINADEVWTETGSSIDIHVESDLIINAHVEVDQGISILVEDGAAIIVRDGGSFEVKGRSGSEVKIFGTGNDDQATWRGIYFNSDSNDNELSHVEIKGAGSAVIEIGDKKNDAAAVEVLGTLWMTNCEITSSTEVGVLVNGNSTRTSNLRNFENIEINGVSTYPMMVEFEALNNFSEDLSSCVFEENGTNMIGLFGDTSGISGNHTWHGASVPYYVSEGLAINGGLEIVGNTELVMQKNAELYVNSTNASYYFNINGTASAPITIRGEEPGINSWPGIWYNTNNANNRISHTSINGGGVPSGTAEKSAIFVSGLSSPGSTLVLNNVDIQNSECALRKGPTAIVTGTSSITLAAGVNASCE